MKTILDLLALQWVIVFLIDISGGVNTLKSLLSLILTKGKIKTCDYTLKPFDCSLCVFFWTGMVYLLIAGFTLRGFALVCFLSATTSIVSDIYWTLIDLVKKILNKI